MLLGIIIGIVATTLLWVGMFLLLGRGKTEREKEFVKWNEATREILERKNEILEELCEIIRLKGENG